MLNSFAKKNNYDLDGYHFKKKFENTHEAILIDVRTPEEYGKSTIKGAENIDQLSPSFHADIQKLSKENSYFVFCRSGGKSNTAVKLMTQIGLKAYNLIGGIGAWPD